MGGTAVADELAAARLDERTGGEAGSGDGDEGVAGFDEAAGPGVEGAGVPCIHRNGDGAGIEAGAGEQVVGGVEEREGGDERAGKALAFEARPRPGGVDLAQVVAAMELVGQFEVMEDAEDGLGDSHER